MDRQDTPQSASPEEEARIGEIRRSSRTRFMYRPCPAARKLPLPRPRRVSSKDLASPRVAVFLQHADLAALRRLLDWAASAAETRPEGIGGSMH